MSLSSLEFERVLRLVAAFAKSERGREHVLRTLPRPTAGEGLFFYRQAREMTAFVAARGSLSLDGLDAAELLTQGAGITLGPAELARLVTLIRRIVEVRAALLAGDLGLELARIANLLPQLEGLVSFCEQRLGPAGEVLDSASPQIAQARVGRERHRQSIISALNDLRRNNPHLQAPLTVRRDRYCVPVPIHDRASVTGLVLDVSATAATVFIEPFAIVELNNALAEAIATERAEEERILAEVGAAFARQEDSLTQATQLLAELDACQARVLFGQKVGGRLIEPGVGGCFRLLQARHPLLDPRLAELRRDILGEEGNTKPIVALDLEFPAGKKLILLSGPNAGGKTVALKTVGLAALMAATGIPVLAEEGTAVPEFSTVWCYIGDEQSLFSDLSTFTAAMTATASLLRIADANTLVLYDELGSGTDPEEGAALAAALLEELASRGCWTVATAHLLTVSAHLEQVQGTVNAAMGFDESHGRPTYRLLLGVPGRSRGLEIAGSCGLPADLLERSRELVSKSFLAIDTYLAALQAERDKIRGERDLLCIEQLAAREAAAQAHAEASLLASEKQRVKASLAEERDRLRRRATEQIDAALAELKAAKERGEFPGKKRVITIRRAALATEGDGENAEIAPLDGFALGATVKMRSLGARGVVQRVVGDRIEVQVGSTRVWVEKDDCELLATPAKRASSTVSATSESTPAVEIKLLGLTQEEAREELERFLDQAVMAGNHRIRIVHGHGTGALRRMVRDFLTAHPAVVTFAHPPQFRGGTGATEVELE